MTEQNPRKTTSNKNIINKVTVHSKRRRGAQLLGEKEENIFGDFMDRRGVSVGCRRLPGTRSQCTPKYRNQNPKTSHSVLYK